MVFRDRDILQKIAPGSDRRFDQLISLPLHHTEFEIQKFHGNIEHGGGSKEGAVVVDFFENFFIVHQKLCRKEICFLFRRGALIVQGGVMEGAESSAAMQDSGRQGTVPMTLRYENRK